MKSLFMKDILMNIGGSLINGEDSLLVRHVATRPEQAGDNVLLFHMDSKKDIGTELLNRKVCPAIVTENPEFFDKLMVGGAIVHVPDINYAYWKFVDYYRGLFKIPVIGVTGTCGKTTTKEMIRLILSKRYNVQSTYLNDNSMHFNLPYLLSIDERTQAAVFEMGVCWPGNLENSCRHFKPDIRILLNIGVYHILGCGSLEGYIKAKSELLEGLDPETGVLILSTDDINIKKIDVSRFKNIVYFGLNEHAEFRARDIIHTGEGIAFTLCHRERDYPVFIPGFGKHNAYNALAAVAAVHHANVGISIDEACNCLKDYKPVQKHLQIRNGIGGCTIIDDSWNSTPPSLTAALEFLKEFAGNRKKAAVLGYMLNLGAGREAAGQYADMGRKAVEAGIGLLVVIGKRPVEIGRKAIELGLDENKVFFVEDGMEAREVLYSHLDTDTVVLVKSRQDRVNLLQ